MPTFRPHSRCVSAKDLLVDVCPRFASTCQAISAKATRVFPFVLSIPRSCSRIGFGRWFVAPLLSCAKIYTLFMTKARSWVDLHLIKPRSSHKERASLASRSRDQEALSYCSKAIIIWEDPAKRIRAITYNPHAPIMYTNHPCPAGEETPDIETRHSDAESGGSQSEFSPANVENEEAGRDEASSRDLITRFPGSINAWKTPPHVYLILHVQLLAGISPRPRSRA